jgi:hypothetical protein
VERLASVGLVLLLGASAALTTEACGSGGGDGQLTLEAMGEAALDGWVRSDGFVNAAGGGPLTGDFDSSLPNIGFRQFFSFDISALPAGAVILSATLRIYQDVAGGTPYATHGTVLADHMNYGAPLMAAAYLAAPLAALGTFSSTDAQEYKTMDVTARVQADVDAARAHSQYRLRFSALDSDNDGVDDYTTFVDTENSCCIPVRPPSILITYLAP